MLSSRRSFVVLITLLTCVFFLLRGNIFGVHPTRSQDVVQEIYRLPKNDDPSKFQWGSRHDDFPVTDYEHLPRPCPRPLPKVQSTKIGKQTSDDLYRQNHVKQTLQRAWKSYRERAWLKDELAPLSGNAHTTFGGWAATLVDTLDTLWIMDLKREFYEAVDAIVQIDFTETSADNINVFETTIRYMGGFLSAYDLSGDTRLLDKSLELADMIYAAFDTPNRMPILRWDFHQAAKQEQPQVAQNEVLVAEIGSLSLEFTRLSQITHDPKWYDAIARVMAVFEAQQNSTSLPGMWPLVVNARDTDFKTGTMFTLGAMADSVYEYLPKMIALLGGSEQYSQMYSGAMEAAAEHTLYRPMTPQDADILMTGPAYVEKDGTVLPPEGQHLACFSGGMYALGGRLLRNDAHVAIGRKLTDGCTWAYKASLLGIMPETFTVVACEDKHTCHWNEEKWHAEIMRKATDASGLDVQTVIERERLVPGFASIGDRRYILRPEAIESVFILYRITGDRELQQTAWAMYQSIINHTETAFANAALADVTHPEAPKSDSMESFWTAETLKYFYLVFSEPTLISLDEFVFNTEAHPFRRA